MDLYDYEDTYDYEDMHDYHSCYKDDLERIISELKTELFVKDQQIEKLEWQIKQLKEKRPVGRPAKYSQYYELIEYIYSQCHSATLVAKRMHGMGVEISVRQVNNIIRKLKL